MKKSLPKQKHVDIAVYDYNQSYKYSTYWAGRKYEHLAEVNAIKALLAKAGAETCKFDILIDIGAGFGRLFSVYAPYTKNVILGDYSLKELKEATTRLQNMSKSLQTNVFFVGLNAYFMPFKRSVFDMAISVRVMHHIIDIKRFLHEVYRILRPGGYFILEVANKNHIKAILRALWCKDKKFFRLKRIKQKHRPQQSQGITSVQQGYIFYNYNVNYLLEIAQKRGFTVIAARQVSILRHPLLKKFLPVKIMTWLDRLYQWASQILNKRGIYLTPSVFVLLHKPAKPGAEQKVSARKMFLETGQIINLLQCPNHRKPLTMLKNAVSCPKGDHYKKIGPIIDLRFPPVESIIS